MLKYIGKRILTSIVTIWAVITIVFFLVRIMPGGPFEGEKITAEMKEVLNEKYGLDKPVGEQYVIYMKGLLKGDFGQSMKYKGRQVVDTIKNGFPKSAQVGAVAIIASVVVGILLGVVAALNANKWPDRICMIIATLGITIPSFVIGSLLIFIFTVKLGVLGATGLSKPSNYIMPVIALALYPTFYIARLMRSSMLDVMGQDYMRTARAKGVSTVKMIFKHALRNAILPVITYMGPLLASLMTGSFIIEKIFNIPGLGSEFVGAITSRDYPMIMGTTIFLAVFVIFMNVLVDIAYAIVDPRIKLK